MLFSTGERSDGRPALHAESCYDFLDRVDSAYFGGVRDLLEAWYSEFPDDDGHLVSRLRSGDDRQHLAAFWELYLHAALRAAGLKVEVHPAMDPDTNTSPDFRVTDGTNTFLLEARLIQLPGGEQADERRIATVYDSLNSVSSPDFFLWLDVVSQGSSSPSTRGLRSGLEEWLRSLNPSDVEASSTVAIEGWAALPTFTWESEGWSFRFRALPKNETTRGRPGIRPMAAYGPGEARIIDDHTPLVTALRAKSPSRYGTITEPYVIALLSDRLTINSDDVASALFGRQAVSFIRKTDGSISAEETRLGDGYLFGDSGPRNTRVSGVLIAHNLVPWRVASNVPRMWLNPWASIELPHQLTAPWATARPDHQSSEMKMHAAEQSIAQVLGLDPGWPGPEDLRDV